MGRVRQKGGAQNKRLDRDWGPKRGLTTEVGTEAKGKEKQT